MLIVFQDLTVPAAFCFATGMYAAGSIPVLLIGVTPPQWLVHARHDINRAIASACHEVTPYAAYVWRVVYAAREVGRDAAALLLMLTTIPTGDLR